MPINKFVTYIEKSKRYSQHTLKSYRTDLLQLSAYLENVYEKEILDAQPQMLRSWVIELLETGISNKSVNRKISSVKSFYNHFLKEGIIDTLPTIKITAPKISKRLPNVVKESEMSNLLDDFHFEDTYFGKRDELIIELLYSCGLRVSELIQVKEQDINTYNSTLKILGKRNKERIVPLHRVVVEKIKHLIELKREVSNLKPELLLTNKGRKMYTKFVYRKVKYYLEQVTTSKKKSPHVLRHTFATHMLNNGADLNTIKEILGHANLSATEVYTHNTIEKLKNSYNQAHPRA